MIPRKDRCCGNCDKWQQKEGEHGECRARPPIVFPVLIPPSALDKNRAPQQGYSSVFPPMGANGYCGEWLACTEGEG